MSPPDTVDRRAFYILLALLTLAFFWVLLPFYGAVLWGAILALMFQPLYLKLLPKVGHRPWLASLITLGAILVIVVLPLIFVGISLVTEVTTLYQGVKSGDINFGRYFDQIVAAMPTWATSLLDRLGLSNLAALQEKLTAALTQRGQAVAERVVDIGQDVLDVIIGFCIAMYLLFFLLCDGASLVRRIREAIPLAPHAKARLFERFATMIRATVKGNILVAIVQGSLGGLAFWVLGIHAALLWAVVMAFLSLLPAIGAALIWAPVALYLLATGEVGKGIGLIVFGVVVIGLVDNVLRPILVGKDTRLPDYMVLIATVGGLVVFGINGFVIGPVIAAMFIASWQIFTDEHRSPSSGQV